MSTEKERPSFYPINRLYYFPFHWIFDQDKWDYKMHNKKAGHMLYRIYSTERLQNMIMNINTPEFLNWFEEKKTREGIGSHDVVMAARLALLKGEVFIIGYEDDISKFFRVDEQCYIIEIIPLDEVRRRWKWVYWVLEYFDKCERICQIHK